MAVHAAAIFLSAFLLFQVQPLAGKTLLPWYGGSAQVWSTCLVFFQAVLFLGYLYAHLLGTRLAPRRQALAHLALLGISLASLPVGAGSGWQPADQSLPVPRILGFLAATVGLPCFLLSANGPLVQRWYALRFSGSPWRLYALSNLGSLLGLLAYPFLVEPRLALGAQRGSWSAGYALFAAAAAVCAAGLARSAPPGAAPAADAVATDDADPSRARTALVLSLALAGSLLMAAGTHHLCQNVAVVPLLWIVPLALYLVSFVVVFAGERWYSRRLLLPLLAALTVAATALLFLGLRAWLPARVAVLLATLFVGCLVMHGELARLKPPARGLTGYYLLVAAGGVLGSAFAAFAAPALFTGYWEYHVALALCWTLALVAALRAPAAGRTRPGAVAAAALSVLALVLALRWQTLVAMAQSVRAERNFYGALQVVERDAEDPARRRLELAHGGVVHGSQLAARPRRPTVYYGPASGLAAGIRAARARSRAAGGEGRLAIGCVGLGVGSLAAHLEPGDALRFYELDPAVLDIARGSFTFLADTAGALDVALGDGRLSLERELASGRPRGYDLLVVDAFTGDAIPAHLLTRESLRLYRAHLARGGRVMLHVSNRYLDLRPLVLGLARDAGLEALVIDTVPTDFADFGATWASLADDPAAFSDEERRLAAASRPLPAGRVLWTDEYSSLFGVLDRTR